MPVFNFINQSTESPPKQQLFSIEDYDFLQTSLNSSEWVSAKTALQNSDLFTVINQLSSDLAIVKLTAKKKQTQGILDNPSTNASRHGFYQSIFAQLLLSGEAFVYRWRNENGRDIKWEFIRPSQVTVNRFEYENGLYYNISFEDPKIATKLYVPQSDVLHFRLLSVDGGKTGVSPLDALNREINIQKASDRLTLSALKNALNANGILKVKGGGLLDEKTKMSRSREAMRQMQGGPLVLDDLEDFTPLEIKSNIAQLLSQTDWTSKQFAKVYGIPDSYLGGQGDQQSSIEMISGMYANAVSRYIRPFVSELTYKLGDDIDTDLFPAVDPTGSTYIKRINELVKNGTVAQNQGLYMLQQAEILPQNLPESSNPNHAMKGGEDNGTD
ncbi:portal protein [Streptococcus phage phiKSM96]|nr:phage portal protein [Streptococcus mutans]WGL32723.1 portal protein [Streptococcus phage phiKSM96]